MKRPSQLVPHIGLLYWLKQEMESTFCSNLFRPFWEQAEQGRLTYEFLCPSIKVGDRNPYPPLETVRAREFDGLVSVSIWSEPYLGELVKLGKPLVTLDFRSNGWPIDSVTFGNKSAFRRIAQILRDTGHSDILYVSMFRPNHSSEPGHGNFIEDDTSMERRLALQQACGDLSLELWPLLPVWIDQSNLFKQVSKHLPELIADIGHPPSAITGHDSEALTYAMAALSQQNLAVPKDLSLITVGSETNQAKQANTFPMDMIVFSWRQMGLEGLRLLLDRISGKMPLNGPPRHLELPGRYVSAGTVADRRVPST